MPIAPQPGQVQRSCFCFKKWLFKALSFDIKWLILIERCHLTGFDKPPSLYRRALTHGASVRILKLRQA